MVFEVGRRYKILNPERMREAYGKLMYVLQDSNLPVIKELLQFSCIKPVRTVWDVGKFSGGILLWCLSEGRRYFRSSSSFTIVPLIIPSVHVSETY